MVLLEHNKLTSVDGDGYIPRNPGRYCADM